MKLSIAMCTFNGARYLREQLESIASQRVLPDELVVCDDRSTDSTKEIIEEFASRAPFTVRLYVNEKNLGPCQNFARAISLCNGDIIALADQDDFWEPEKLGRIMLEFPSHPEASLVFSDAEVVDEDMCPRGYRAWESTWVEFGPKEQQLFKNGKALDVLLTRNVVTGATIAFRSSSKDLILPIPEMNDSLLHDYWIALVIATVSNLAWIDEPLVKYRHHEEQHKGLMPPGSRVVDLPEPGDLRRFNPVQVCVIEAIRERLVSKNRAGRYDQAISKLEHLQIRANMKRKVFGSRVWQALKELSRGRYHSYSDGLRSAFEDISLPHKFLQLKAVITNLPASHTRRG